LDIVLVRHAEPAWEAEGRSVDDPGLTDRGHAQAACAATALGGESFDHFYVSPKVRSMQTAEPIAKALGMQPTVQGWLEEIRLPTFEGRLEAEVQQFFEDARSRELERWWEGLPGGETFRHFHERVTGGIESLLVGDHALGLHEEGGHRLWQLSDAPEQRVLIVAHSGTNAVVLSHLLGVEPVPFEWIRFASAWAGIHRLTSVPISTGFIWMLERFNEAMHLADVGGALGQ